MCGGKGTRFQEVSSTLPKILVKINKNQTMLDWLANDYLPQNSEIILATGHLHNIIENYISSVNYRSRITFSKENQPLGTGGALALASRLIKTKDFIALNGDTIQEVNLLEFLQKTNMDDSVKLNIACTDNNYDDSGSIHIDYNNYIIKFAEKTLPEKQHHLSKIYTSIGLYRCKTEYFRSQSVISSSLESDIIPMLVKEKSVKATPFSVKFHDYGTLDRYKKMNKR
ncbi:MULTISPECIES: sugar phosphate nucleotidyltransferase [unclassified Prochlorococcus]|uniref:nucleotidyltransferase family protein n=1 Tax=unclassified Prochlorococcus TaxID=2627481 RepID=UPI0006906174|nr:MULTISPECIES: sugar phosphate nucleotidyltransferase [unclassified Prochlorococcus]